MASSSATTAPQYLAELPSDRRSVMTRVRDLVRDNLPAGYEEGMDYGMIVWSIPLARYPDTYNGHALGYVALAAQKHYYALYLSTYMSEEHMAAFTRAFAQAGKRMDMGKSCLRFKAVEELPLDVIAREIARTPPEEFIALYERSRAGSTGAAKATSRPTAKAPAKSAVKQMAGKKTAKPAAPSTTKAGASRPRRGARA